MLKTKVKVGSVTNLSEARYCAGMGVDFLSFPVPTVDPKMYQEITAWVTGPQFGIEVGVGFENLDQYSADFVQANCDTLDQIPDMIKVIVSLTADQWETEKERLQGFKSKILALEFTISAIDATTRSILEQASKQFDIFIKLRNPADIDQVLQLPVAGVSMEGSAEVRVGLKEYPLAEVLEKLEVE